MPSRDPDLFDSVFRHASIGLAVVDLDGKWSRVNDALCRMLSRSREELLATDVAKTTHPDDRALDLEIRRDLREGRIDSCDIEKRYLSGRGETVWANVTVSAARREDGTTRFFIAQIQDVSARKRAEFQSNAFFQASLDLLAIAGKSGMLEVVNPAWERVLGWSMRELATRPFIELVHPDDRAATVAEAEAVYAGRSTLGFRNRYLAKNGAYHWLEWNTQPSPDGRLYCAVRDVTREQNALAALAMSEKRYRTLAEGSIQGIVVERVHEDFKPLYVNEAAARMFGFASASEAMTLPSLSILAPAASLEEARRAWQLLIEGHLPSIQAQIEMTKRDGTPIWIELMGSVVDWDGAPALQMTLVDVTEKKRMSDAIQRSARIQATMFRNFPNGAVFLFDHDLRFLLADGSTFFDVIGLVRGSIEGRTLDELVSADNRSPVTKAFRDALEGRETLLHLSRNGREFEERVVPVRDDCGAIIAGMAIAYDVTDRHREAAELRAAREQLQHQAEELRAISITDALTGLVNRRGFLLLAEQQLRLAARKRQAAALLFIDLDGMKQINDQLGHDAGDEALRDTATALKSTFRESDVIARLGGDEFVVLALDCPSESLTRLRARLEQNVKALNARPNRPFVLAMSIGTTVSDPASPRLLEELLADADARMYEEKKAHHRR